MEMGKPVVLFICTANSCRSQMAEGFLRHLGGDHFEAASAGARPTHLNADAVRVMQERGIDISKHHSKDVTEFWKQRVHYVITVCDKAKETCPIFPFALTKLHWSLEDPAAAEGTEAQRLAVFRRIRDEIEGRVLDFVAKESRPVARVQ
jgi:arsenate reductase (thioredoxin)